MNLNRVIDGAILSILFLTIFVYAIFGVQWIFNNSLRGLNEKQFLGSLSDSFQNPVSDNTGQSIPAENPYPEIKAESAISIESNLSRPGGYPDKIIFEKAGDKKLPIASLTKLMTAVVVLDNYNLSDIIGVDKIADSQEPIKHDVKLGDTMPVESFLEIMLVGSSNKSAYALSQLVGEQKFVELMNKKAKNLGMENTFFADPTGLNPENISTANDLAKLAIHILKRYPKIAETSRMKELYVPKFGNVVNTDELLNKIPNIICSKTGFTIEANGCLLLVVGPNEYSPKNNDYLINVILGSNDRFSEMQKLIDWSNIVCQ